MTKEEMENIIKRYRHVERAIKENLPVIVFYIGNRRKIITITEEVKTVYEVINLVHESEQDENIRYMIKLIKNGKSDTYVMQEIHCSKNAYYARKFSFIEKVFNCCIYRGLVGIEEILNERIA